MYLQANPGRGRSTQEKLETGQKYKPGDPVMVKTEQNVEDSEEEEDRRMVEEVRDMSLREVGVRGPGTYERSARHRGGSRDSRDDEARQRRRRDHDRRRREEGRSTARGGAVGGTGPTDSRAQARQIEHQSSLRSLLSNSDGESSLMEEEILRQIIEEGLLDGIDPNNMNAAQEDELSERIADAYRRRHSDRPRSQNSPTEERRGLRTYSAGQYQSQQHRDERSPNIGDQSTNSSHPPVSRSQLLDAYPVTHGRRRRTSSDSRRQRSPPPTSSPRGTSRGQRQAARSATDLPSRPHTAQIVQNRPTELSSQGRRTTDPQPHGQRNEARGHPRQISQGADSDPPIQISSPRSSDSQVIASLPSSSQVSGPITHDVGNFPGNAAPQGTPYPLEVPKLMPRPSSSPSTATVVQPELYLEPSIRCDRCGKLGIEYELHENCSVCREGQYNLCLRCYRLGLGCLHWYGFGYAGWQRYERQAPPSGYSPSHQLPHTLTAHRFLRPGSLHPSGSGSPQRLSIENPAKRLQSGAFCSNCSAFANDCFWKCSLCNEGEWGFCNHCVNQGKCCTHPLLPVAHTSASISEKQLNTSIQHSFALLTSPKSRSRFNPYELISSPLYTPLTFSTKCDICTYPIQPSNTRYHCSHCNEGNYNICTTCYLKAVITDRISKENGDKGWRRCFKGHRMIVIGFEDSPVGQRRIVVKDLVGGHALKDDMDVGQGANEEWSWQDGERRQIRTVPKQMAGGVDDSNATAAVAPLLKRYPPDGGVGMKVLAMWSYWPQEGTQDELGFPKGAEITEVADINGDWFWGCYAASKGLFPGNYVRIQEVVSM
ncbi:hypothetical protein MMC12_004115 [Toensbergia leucococca]|nr:hypothetical protein [Toensbergia leucococca]